MSFIRPYFLWMVLLCGVGPTLSHAVSLDWDNYNWTAGAPGNNNGSVSQSFNNDPNNTGNDITVSLTNTNTNSTWHNPQGPNNNYPRVGNQTVTGGLSNQDNLQLYIDNNNSKGIKVGIDFTYSTVQVKTVQLVIFDVDEDSPQFIDIIKNIYAVTTANTTIGATLVTSGSASTVTGSGLTYTVTGDSSSSDTATGTVTISFTAPANQGIEAVYFTWANGGSNQGQQWIGLYDITYTVTPEVGPCHMALALCGIMLVGGSLRRKWMTRKVQA